MYAVLKHIDQYRPGQMIDGSEYSAGNLAGLLRSGSIAHVEIPAQAPVRAETVAPVQSVAGVEKARVTSVTSSLGQDGADLSGLTVAELRELAKAAGVDGYSKMRKADLISALGK